MSAQITAYGELEERQWRWFKTYINSYHPYTDKTPTDAAQDGERASVVREQWAEWDALARHDLPDDVADTILEAFYVEMTVDAAAAYADVHPAHAFGEYMRNDIPDSRNLPYLSHDRSALSDDDRRELLHHLDDGATRDDVVEQFGSPEQHIARIATTYLEHTE